MCETDETWCIRQNLVRPNTITKPHATNLPSRKWLDVRRVGVQLLPTERNEAQDDARRHLQRKGQHSESSCQLRLRHVEQHQGETRQQGGHQNGKAEGVQPHQKPGIFLYSVEVHDRVIPGCKRTGGHATDDQRRARRRKEFDHGFKGRRDRRVL